MKITIQQVLTELEREINMRKRLYPGWIQKGKISEPIATKRIACLTYAKELLQEKKDKKDPSVTQGKLF